MNFPAACHELIEHGRPLLVEKFEDRSHCSIVLIVFVKHPIAIYISFYTSYIYIYQAVGWPLCLFKAKYARNYLLKWEFYTETI